MSNYARRLGRLLITLAVTGLSACTGLPPRGAAEHSAAFTDTQTTTLGQVAAGSTPVGHSVFGLLPTGDSAFGVRSALAARAERSLDLQYYHLHSDHAGTAFLRELLDASRRGVRVRLLVDDLHAVGTYQSSIYRLRLAKDGSTIEWLLADADGTITRTTEEPHIERLSSGPEGPTVFIDDNLL